MPLQILQYFMCQLLLIELFLSAHTCKKILLYLFLYCVFLIATTTPTNTTTTNLSTTKAILTIAEK